VEIGFLRLLASAMRPRPGYHSAALFADPDVQDHLARHGYCVTDRFVAPEAVEQLRDLVTRHVEANELDGPGGVYAVRLGGGDTALPDSEFVRLWQLLIPQVERAVNPEVARVVFSAVQVKPASVTSRLPAHQDSFVVDERSAFSANAWTSLDDSTVESGALFVLPGSHRFGNSIRVGSEHDDLHGLHEVIERHARVVTSSPGQIVLLDSALIHGSLTNTTGRRRLAVSCHVLPRREDLLVPSVAGHQPRGRVQVLRYDAADLDRTARGIEGGTLPAITGQPAGTRPIDRFTFGRHGLAAACRLTGLVRGRPQGRPLREVAATS
jgi:hypothetical protein